MSEARNQPSYRGGAPTEREVAEFGAQIEGAKQSPYMLLNPTFERVYNADGTVNEPASILRTRAQNSSKFPVRPFPSDPYDSTWSLKDDLARPIRDAAGNVISESMATPARPLPFTEDDVAFLKRKRNAEENVAFLTWQADKYDLTDPATRDW